MRSGLRSSARKESQAQLELDEKARLRERSVNLQRDFEEKDETLNKQIRDLLSICISEQSSSEESIEFEDNEESEEESSRVEESPKGRFVSESSLVWDDQGDLQSPLKDTSDLLDTSFQFTANQDSLPPALSRGRSVSVSVNRADYSSLETGELVELHPVCRDLNRRFETPGPSDCLGLRSQDSFLERNLQAKQAEVFYLIEEGELEGSVEENDSVIPDKEANERSIMDGDTFRNHVMKFKNESRKVMRKINDYTAQNVRIVNANDYENKLLKARNAFEQVRDDLDKVIDELDPASETERIEELENILSELTEAVLKNENEVRDKMAEIIDQNAANKPRNEDDVKKDEHKVLRLQKRMGCLKEKATKIKSSILKVKKVGEMTDNEIRENYIESKVWEKKAAELEDSRNVIDAESIGLQIEDKELYDMKETVQACLDLIENKTENLKREDNARGLFTAVNKNLSRENVAFPANFSGEFGENVFKFKEKFLQALTDSQIREKDKVETLRKHLSGNAKNIIGAHYTDINKAMESLIDYYGNPDRIWSKCIERFQKAFSGTHLKIWGRKGDECRIMAVSRVIEFLREAVELAQSYENLSGEIYHSSTLKLVLRVLPRIYVDEYTTLVKGLDKNTDKKQLIEILKDVLENMKDNEITTDNLLSEKEDSSKKVLDFYADRGYGDRGYGDRGHGDYEEDSRGQAGYGSSRGRRGNYSGGRGRRRGYGNGRGYQDCNDGNSRDNDGIERQADQLSKCNLCSDGKYCIAEWQGL